MLVVLETASVACSHPAVALEDEPPTALEAPFTYLSAFPKCLK